MRVHSVLPLASLLLAGQHAFAFVTPHTAASIHPAKTTVPSALALAGAESLVTDLMVTTSSTAADSPLLLADYPVSPEPIHTAFKVGTFFSQPFFLLMILLPKSSITKKIMGGLGKYSQRNSCQASWIVQ